VVHELFSRKKAHNTRKNRKKIFDEPFRRVLAHDGVKNHHDMKIQTCFQTFALFAAALSAAGQTTTATPPAGNPASGEVFFRVDFPNVHGNGRSCATCHVPEEAFQLTPEHVENHFQNLQQRRLTNPAADDALFRPQDANDGAEDFTNLRRHALVRVFIPLPTDAQGQKLMWPLDDPEATVVAVWRATPTVMNTAFTAPYQLDGRQATLEAQALGALIGHSEITTAPKTRFLEDVAAFEKAQFSSPAVGLLAEALAAGTTPPLTDPPLNELEQRGKVLFDHHCAVCHGGSTLTTPLSALPPGIHNIHVSKPVPPFGADLPFAPSPVQPRLWAFRVPGQVAPVVIPSTDPGKALLTGNKDELNFFDIPTLYGISKTAPYFHDNSAATMEEVIRHYQLDFELLRRVIPAVVPWPLRPDLILDEEFAPLSAYLKKI
jgi:cytochrome c peroxidase